MVAPLALVHDLALFIKYNHYEWIFSGIFKSNKCEIFPKKMKNHKEDIIFSDSAVFKFINQIQAQAKKTSVV